MRVVRRILRWILNTVSVVVIILAICMLLSVVMSRSGQAPSFFGYSVFRVMSGSMEPTLPVNTLLLVHETDPADVQEQDIISFYSRDPMLGGAVNTHRVVQIQEENGTRTFITKGDANVIADKYEVKEQDVIGTVVFSSLLLGTLVRLVSNPIIFVPLILIPLLLMLTMNFIKTIRLSKTMLKEEFEQADEDETSDKDETPEGDEPAAQDADPKTD